MGENLTPFWENSYRSNTISAFGVKPNPEIETYLSAFNKHGKVLEAGCGEAKNALYLVEHGFTDVHAFDLSPNAIDKVGRICRARGLTLDAFTADLTAYPWKDEEQFDLILSYGTLHFAPRDGWRRFLAQAMEHTNSGGLHVMQIFTDKVPASPDIAAFAVGLAKEGELLALYADWEILFHAEFILDDEHPGAPLHQHAINKIVARKR